MTRTKAQLLQDLEQARELLGNCRNKRTQEMNAATTTIERLKAEMQELKERQQAAESDAIKAENRASSLRAMLLSMQRMASAFVVEDDF